MSQQEPVIEVKSLSKSYQISHKTGKRADTIKDSFANLIKHPFKDDNGDKHETFWALKDVSFTVNKGEVFGIVGRNGSGKSTMLKILSRIVSPTNGSSNLRGRTASLLEVGTGFHPELTGRENVYFNGSMLGMSRKEIRKKFDEIVAFSEVEKFIDTPVKFYSSGMYVRLAFSVAAHLEPDILILDEVLAVGDASFQKKSLNKIVSTMEDGRTVLFVSHSMGAVQQICNRGLLLRNGEIDYIGDVDGLTSRYAELMRNENTNDYVITPHWKNDGSLKNGDLVPLEIFISDSEGNRIGKASPNNIDYYLNIFVDVIKENDLYTIGYMAQNQNKTMVYMSYESDLKKSKRTPLKKGRAHFKSKIPAHLLNGGVYRLSFLAGIYNKGWIFDPEENNPSVQIMIEGGFSQSPYWTQARSGIIAPLMEWEIQQ